MFSEALLTKLHNIQELCLKHNFILSTAESCTGGLISYALTELPGSSNIFDSSFITYSNSAKKSMLEVSSKILAKHGAVSSEVAEAMAQGAIYKSSANISIATTGIAGPSSDNSLKPIGLVYIATNFNLVKSHVRKFHFEGTRSEIRLQTLYNTLNMLIEFINEVSSNADNQ